MTSHKLRRLQLSVIATLLVAAPLAGCAAESPSLWMVGSWTATSDEDGSPPDIMEFREDGTWINYGIKCAAHSEMPFHIYGEDVYITIQIAGKGPTAIVFHPNQEKSKLTFTSPRTANNAVYERIATNPCSKKG